MNKEHKPPAKSQNKTPPRQKVHTLGISVDLRDGRGWKTMLDQSSKVCAYMLTEFFHKSCMN